MKATTRRSLRRVWRVMSWPLPSHLAFALATGLASGVAAAHYPDVISAPYAAILGTLAVGATREGFRCIFRVAGSTPEQGRIFAKFWTPILAPLTKSLFVLASPTGFEPVLPP